MIPAEDIHAIETAVRAQPWARDKDINIRSFKPLAGGSVNNVFRIETTLGPFCLKYNQAPVGGAMFASEAQQLGKLLRLSPLRVPVVKAQGSGPFGHFLLLEYLERGAILPTFWEKFGRLLARQHRVVGKTFGGVADNFIGPLPQPNTNAHTWQDFFAGTRLLPLARMAMDKNLLTPTEVAQVERVCIRLAEVCPNDPPSLVHGDLWKGNYLIGPEGQPCIIDPAMHFGHREADLAMTLLFSGFDEPFYDAYQNEWPLVPGFAHRFQIYNLYPLLVHLILFGTGYHFGVKSILDEWGN